MSGGPRVLIVDDSVVQRGILEDVIAEVLPHAQVRAVDNPQTALSLLAAPPLPQLVFSDFNMPGMNGVLFAGEARRQGFLGDLYMVSTERSPELMASAREVGVTGWVVKPFTIQQFETLLAGRQWPESP